MEHSVSGIMQIDQIYFLFNVKNMWNHQMWDSLIKVQCSVDGISSSWMLSIEKDLQKRISKVRTRSA